MSRYPRRCLVSVVGLVTTLVCAGHAFAASESSSAKDLIAGFVKGQGYSYSVDQSGDYLVRFSNPSGTEYPLRMSFMAGSFNPEVFEFLAKTDMPLAAYKFSKALEICNEWNSEKRKPKANLMKSSDGKSATVELRWSLDAEKGVSQETFDLLCDQLVDTCYDFWTWAVVEKKL